MGNGDLWLVYVTSSMDWNVQSTANKGSDACAFAYCDVPKKCLPQDCPARKWFKDNVTAGSDMVLHPAITVRVVNGK